MSSPKRNAPRSRGADLPTVADRRARGKAQRKAYPRSALAHLEPRAPGRNLLAILRADCAGRVPDLVPVRNGRMLASPFAFFRGSAAVMIDDIGRLPHTGIETQLCGDCHIRNFGGFASPERTLLFGINDYDQTHPGPFEWDVKRLASSVVVAARDLGMSGQSGRDAAAATAASYRRHMGSFAGLSALDLWHFRIEASELVGMAGNANIRRQRQALIDKAAERTAEKTFRKLAHVVDGTPRIREQPPLIYHLPDVQHFEDEVRTFLDEYARTLTPERRALLGWYSMVDVAFKVSGIGSVGLRCAVALLMAGADDPLFLQLKEARRSVLEPFAAAGRQRNHGLRIVVGQHRMQAAADPFLGWFRDRGLRKDFYVRQLNDMKFSLDSGDFSPADLVDYAQICGWELARAHAKAGDPAVIAGYLGDSEAFDDAIAEFAIAYADQTESDYRQFVNGVNDGTIHAVVENA